MRTVADDVRELGEDVDAFLDRHHGTGEGTFIHRVLRLYVDAPDHGQAEVEGLDMSPGQRLEVNHALWVAHHLAVALSLEAEDREVEAYQQLLDAQRHAYLLKFYSMTLERLREKAGQMKAVQRARHAARDKTKAFAIERAAQLNAASTRQAAQQLKDDVIAYGRTVSFAMSEAQAFETIYAWLLAAAKEKPEG